MGTYANEWYFAQMLNKSKTTSYELTKTQAVNRFQMACEAYSQFMAKYGRSVGAWNQKSIDLISELPTEMITNKSSNLLRNLNYYLSAEKENISPEKEVQVLWRILKNENWRFPDDLFPSISNNEVIEIYNLDFTQYFANSTFMVNCSYDLSDLNAYSWPELFERPQHCTDKIIKHGISIIENPKKQITAFDVETHIGKERFSKEKRPLEIRMGITAPLFDKNNNLKAIITTFEPRILNH